MDHEGSQKFPKNCPHCLMFMDAALVSRDFFKEIEFGQTSNTK